MVAAEGLLDILSSAGKIAIGLRVDLVQARSRAGLPVVQPIWQQAKRMF
ncbi:PhnM protein [Pseudomonas sp. JV449]|nr:PhnM protein [Pseudomonas sp. JV449]MDT9631567.1 PhnM protein [Pseudomonas sp. JV449]